MGAIVQANCPCGFITDSLFVGSGMNYIEDKWNPEPAICLYCFRFHATNYNSKRPRCPGCRKRLTFYIDDSKTWQATQGEQIFDIYRSKCRCPDCDQLEMTFEVVGVWD